MYKSQCKINLVYKKAVNIMKDIGGYFELESFYGIEYHENAIALNRAANCLAYIIKAKNIKKLYIPYFLCRAIKNTCKRMNCEYEFYNIDSSLKPIIDFEIHDNEYIYIVNYYGQLTNMLIYEYKEEFGSIIVDNVQAFFEKPVDGTDALYSCRKFFGVPDGGYLYTDIQLGEVLSRDISHDRMNHVLGRFEEGSQKFYNDYTETERSFACQPIMMMSKLTHNLLRGIDYEFIKNKRTENFSFLYKALSDINKLDLIVPDGAFMYPLYIENGAKLKKFLIQNKIFVPTLWSDVYEVSEEGTLEYDFAKNIVPLPIDQRYNIEDMKYIIKTIKEF